MFAFARRSASGASAPAPADGDCAAEPSARGVHDALAVLLRGVDSSGAQGEVRGLLLRAAEGAVRARIFWRFSVACEKTFLSREEEEGEPGGEGGEMFEFAPACDA